jgi:HK97 family phage prohead protease
MEFNDRFKRTFDIFAPEDGVKSLKLQGRAIAFERPTLIRGIDSRGEERKFYEVVDQHSLDRCDMKDVPLRSEHNTKTIYARTRNKSLDLNVRPDGLHITAYLLDNEKSRTLYEEVRSGLVPQMSFAFPLDSVIVSDGTHKGLPLRRVMDIPRLLDVSVCAYGAYGDDTYINARSFDWMTEQDQGALIRDRNIYSMKLRISEALQKAAAYQGKG